MMLFKLCLQSSVCKAICEVVNLQQRLDHFTNKARGGINPIAADLLCLAKNNLDSILVKSALADQLRANIHVHPIHFFFGK